MEQLCEGRVSYKPAHVQTNICMPLSMRACVHLHANKKTFTYTYTHAHNVCNFLAHCFRTGQYVDHAARASSLEATHAQLLALMKRADQVSDVLKVQQELHRISEQLESQKAVMQRLKKDSTFSTIRLQITPQEETPVDNGNKPKGIDSLCLFGFLFFFFESQGVHHYH